MDKDSTNEYIYLCHYCGKKYEEKRKPIIMNCGHNICFDCVKLNRESLKCIFCPKRSYNKKRISRFPINFALFELVQNFTNKEEINVKEGYFRCETCKLNLSSDYHRIKFPDHKFEEIKNEEIEIKKKEIEKEANNILKQFDLYNKTIEDDLRIYLEKLFNACKTQSEKINFEGIDIFKIYLLCGFINPADEERLRLFHEKIYKNNIYCNIIKESKNFDDLIEKLNKIDKKMENYLTVEEFLSLFCYYIDIHYHKLNDIDENLKILEKLFEEDNNYREEFTKDIILQLNYGLGDSLSSTSTYNLGHFLINNILYIFEPIEQKIEKYNIKIINDGGNIISKFLTSQRKFYLCTNKNFYQYNLLSNNKVIEPILLPKSDFNEENTQLMILEESIYKISSKSFETLNINDNITSSEWRDLTLYNDDNKDKPIIKPKIINHHHIYLFVIDDNNNEINELYIYYTFKDYWTSTKLKLIIPENENKEKILNIKNYYLFNKGYVMLFGGFENNIFNEYIYIFDSVRKTITRSEKINYQIDDYTKIKDMSLSVNLTKLYLLVNYDNNIIKIYFKDQSKKDETFKLINEIKIN